MFQCSGQGIKRPVSAFKSQASIVADHRHFWGWGLVVWFRVWALVSGPTLAWTCGVSFTFLSGFKAF